MIPRVFRVDAVNRPCSWSWWVITDGRGVMSTLPGEPRTIGLVRWVEVYGPHPGGFLDHPDTIRPDQIGDVLDQVRTAALAIAAGGEGGAS